MPQQDVAQRVQDIWAEFLAEGAPSSINLDSHSYERTSQNLKDPSRYSYEDAQVSLNATTLPRSLVRQSGFYCAAHTGPHGSLDPTLKTLLQTNCYTEAFVKTDQDYCKSLIKVCPEIDPQQTLVERKSGSNPLRCRAEAGDDSTAKHLHLVLSGERSTCLDKQKLKAYK